MRIAICKLTLHENVFFATREIGRLYETERYIHNYALTYALGLANAPYFHGRQTPSYREQLEPLNAAGIYVTPARPVSVAFALSTFKYASNRYHVEMSKAQRNTPTFGRLKELAVNSTFEFAILLGDAAETPRWPSWIRLGLWMGKAELEILGPFTPNRTRAAPNRASYPLNPLDLPDGALERVHVYDLISMPPVSLLDRADMDGEGFEITVNSETRWLPAGLAYRFDTTQEQNTQ